MAAFDRAQEAEFLREIARKLREIANQHEGSISAELQQMAEDFEKHANEFEA